MAVRGFLLTALFGLSVSMLTQTISAATNAETSPAVSEKFIAGKDYEVLEIPVPTRNKDKIEVVELFWYGCGHCYSFESLFEPWKKQLGPDVDIVQMPAIWNKTMELHARAYYTAQALGKIDITHQPFFEALLMKKERLFNQSAIADFYARYGVDKKTFNDTFQSFGVDSQVTLTKSRGRSYRMRGTPEMVVNGKYRISISHTKSQPKMLKVAEYLIEKERKQVKAKAVKAQDNKG